jgi:hypothetical protein
MINWCLVGLLLIGNWALALLIDILVRLIH